MSDLSRFRARLKPLQHTFNYKTMKAENGGKQMRDVVLRPMTKLVSRDVDPGAGMGLAQLRKIAWTYGGAVVIDTPKSGKGTRVRVTLAVN